VLFRRARQLPVFAIDERDLLGRLTLQLMIWISGAKCVEHGSRGSPVFQANQGRARIVFGRRADLRSGRDLLDSEEVVSRRAIVGLLVRLLALLVDRSSEV